MNVRLLVLALLAEQPRHGYEIRKWLVDSHAEKWAEVKPYSVHHALTQLAKEGLAALDRVEPTARRDRSVYAITDDGREELRRLTRKLWGQLPNAYPASVYLLLTFVDVLPPAEVRSLAEALAHSLRAQLADWEAGQAAKAPLPPLWQAMFDNGRAHLRADLELVEAVLSAESLSPPPTR
ncbi:PadR family transcriptional regulator [Amycolatopsis magusensis]|uniref:PadR family transcriptional regulator n=1 Tax=Amycolatopsis magusensis TaxID=882444 RepID=UPI003C2B5C70